MSSPGYNKVWKCCSCDEDELRMTSGDCLTCEHTRCMDCDVHRGSAPEAEDKGKLKAVEEEETGMMAMHQTRSRQGEASSAGFHENPQRQVPELESRMEEMGMGEPWLIEIASRTENHSIYILRQDEDASLILAWNRNLGTLSEQCKSACKTLVSIHLFRMGLCEPSSTPTVLINTLKPISRGEQHKLQIGISRCLIFIGEEEMYDGSNLSRKLPSCQLVFRESRLRRSMDNISGILPPICQPRNRTFSKSPCTGSSIGIAHSDKDTATLGCFVRVCGKTMVLTVDHLIPPGSVDPAITHISEQDRVALLFPTIQSEVKSTLELELATVGHCCFRCISLRNKRIDECGDLSWLFSDSEQSCPLVQKAHENLTRAQERFGAQALLLGKKYGRSGRRFRILPRLSGLPHIIFPQEVSRREMDWALFETECADPIFDLEKPTSFTGSPTQLQPNILIPGAFLRSIGRTSGHSSGQISNTMITIFHGEYETEEWCVLKRDKTDINEWIQGSMGVDGDSGALIIDYVTSDLYGMLWGRIGDGPATVTLFTPIYDILSDIKEQTKSECYVIQGQEMPRPS
jgi:hypothetical protein